MAPPYAEALTEILTSTNFDAEDRCVACNLLHDNRIGPKRSRELDEYHRSGIVARPRDGRAVKASVKDFFHYRIRFTRNPDYLKPDLNSMNFVKKATGLSPEGLNASVSLVQLLDLTRLGNVYIWAEENGHAAFQGFESVKRRLGLGGYLEEQLGRGEDSSLAFLRSVFEAIDAKRKIVPFSPVWCVRWRDFEDYMNEPAERWLELLGMENDHTDENPHWLIALKYPIASVGTLVRPTQMDADWYPFHFPSPHDAPSEKGGHPMDLSMPLPGAMLLSEFIHQQVRHDITQIQAGPKRTYSRPVRDLHQQRRAHHRRILHFYNGMALNEWIGACVDQAQNK